MNPLDRLGLSPLATVDEITAALHEKAEDASDEERRVLRETWEELTLHPRSRLRAALSTFPPRPELSARPAELSRELKPVKHEEDPGGLGVAPLDILPRPSICAAISGRIPPPPAVLPAIEDDPLVGPVHASRRSAS